MASRILTCVSCILYFSFPVIGLIAIVIGFIGLGLYIPIYINSTRYKINTCLIHNHEYDTCYQGKSLFQDSCYSIKWSVEYIISNSTSDRFIFSTITQIYRTSIEALDQLKIYKDKNAYTCYYHNIRTADVQWDRPISARPYLIMTIVGFSLTGIYLVVIGFIILYRWQRRSTSIGFYLI